MSYRLAAPNQRPTIDKDPDASLRYGIDVAGLLHDDDTIASVGAAAAGGVTVSGPEFAGTLLSARVAGGTAGQMGSVTFTWTTTQGDTDERTLYFAVQQR
jgi:alpha-D-ribose 1-methylphosphonate 5-triphosphate diphosphatase PhnM